MSTKRLLASAALGVSLLIAVVAAPSMASAAQAPAVLPQVNAAQQGAIWLSGQLTSGGYIPSSTPGTADLSATANTVLALASAGVDPSGAHAALTYLESHVSAYVDDGGSDGPGQLAMLILDAHALGVDPTTFGGTNLVSRLLATERTSGTDAGLFGVQDPTYDGAFRQGLSLAALAAAGETTQTEVGPAEQWLDAQQCSDGGWTSYVNAENPCNGDPADYEGPDTNSTALAVEGLAAQGALSSKPAKHALAFIKGAQDSDAGWGYEPNAADAPGSSDPDSTALVIQAILALGKSPAKGFSQGSATPVSALDSFQLTSGSGSGAYFFPGSSDPDVLATYQAVPAVAGVAFPFNLTVTTTTLPGATAAHAYSASLAASGGSTPYVWSVIKGTGVLPKGLKLNASTGVISGTPKTSGSFSFAVEVVGAKSSTKPAVKGTAFQTFSLSVS